MKSSPPPAKTKKSSPVPTSTSNITSSLVEGITFGIGSSVGHNIINSISGYFSKSNKPDCSEILKKLNECRDKNSDCSVLFAEYESCTK